MVLGAVGRVEELAGELGADSDPQVAKGLAAARQVQADPAVGVGHQHGGASPAGLERPLPPWRLHLFGEGLVGWHGQLSRRRSHVPSWF
jgi:hypothetical protein